MPPPMRLREWGHPTAPCTDGANPTRLSCLELGAVAVAVHGPQQARLGSPPHAPAPALRPMHTWRNRRVCHACTPMHAHQETESHKFPA
jgi:hypothetical protein